MCRRRLALTVDDIKDNKIKEAVAELVSVHDEASLLTNNLSSQVNAVHDEIESILKRLQSADEKLNETLMKISNQITELTDSVLRYQNLQVQGLGNDEKFKHSFYYVLKNVTNNLRQLVDVLNDKTSAVGVLKTDNEVTLQHQLTYPDASVAPETMLRAFKTSYVNDNNDNSSRVTIVGNSLFNTSVLENVVLSSDLLDTVTNTVVELEPVLDRSSEILDKNSKLLNELQGLVDEIIPTPVERVDDNTAIPDHQINEPELEHVSEPEPEPEPELEHEPESEPEDEVVTDDVKTNVKNEVK